MNLLFLGGAGPHAHDYGLAFLYEGLTNVVDGKVWDYPSNPTYHLSGPEDRDGCDLDSDLFMPVPSMPSFKEAAPIVDAIVLGMPDVTAHRICRQPALASKPIIAVDMSDAVADQRGLYAQVAGRPLVAYLKRELPLGADWGIPFPMCYPAGRYHPDPEPRRLRVVYYATDHNGGGPGLPRREIVSILRQSLPAHQLDMGLYKGQEKGTRPSPEELHARMARGLVGLSWNGAHNWDCNRFWENFAFGLAQVAEQPRIQIPYEPEDGLHCLYGKTPVEIAQKVVALMREPMMALELAARGQAHFHRFHSSEARARQLLDVLRRKG